MSRRYGMEEALQVMAQLRHPEGGCPWDLEQDFHSLVRYTIEETCELIDAIETEDFDNLREELGDLLLQVVFYARLAEEAGHFDFAAVVTTLVEKLLRRHPHVFPDGTLESANQQASGLDVEEVWQHWNQAKEAEQGGAPDASASRMHKLPRSLSALGSAAEIQRRAAAIGFDWDDARGPLRTVRAELDELQQDDADQEAELGDLLFSCVNAARWLGLDAERALREANRRFVRRFRLLEEELAARDIAPSAADSALLEELWAAAKKKDRRMPP